MILSWVQQRLEGSAGSISRRARVFLPCSWYKGDEEHAGNYQLSARGLGTVISSHMPHITLTMTLDGEGEKNRGIGIEEEEEEEARGKDYVGL